MELDGLPSTLMPPPAVTLTFDFLTWSLCPGPWYVHHLILVRLTQIFTKILYLASFLGHCLLWPWLWRLTLKSNQHYEPKYTSDQNWVKFPLLVFDI